MRKMADILTTPSIRRDISDYVVIAMAISALLALLLGSERTVISALLIIACVESIEIPNTTKRKIKENKKHDRKSTF